MQDARDTLDTLLTYGNVDDPLFVHLLSQYRDVAREQSRSDEFEQVVQDIIDLRCPTGAKMSAEGY
jgi:hypothetical protein